MSDHKLEITPSVTVHKLLLAYPELEEVLIGIAPPFKKLRNPILRRTVAKVASIKHIASVGGIPLGELLGRLREAVGQPLSTETYKDEDYFGEQPEWFAADKVTLTIEEASTDPNKMALTVVLEKAKAVRKGEIIELITTFLPAPGIDILKDKGYSAWTLKERDDRIKSYFLKNDA